MNVHHCGPVFFSQVKVRILSIVNRILSPISLISAITMITLFSHAASRHHALESLTTAHENAKNQTLEVRATNWCNQITSENADKMSTLYRDYNGASSQQQRKINSECKQKVALAELVSLKDPNKAFTVTSECTVNESEDTASCTATVTIIPSEKLLFNGYSTTTATLRMRVADTHTNLPTQSHVIDNVATVTIDASGTATTTFDIPFDMSWGMAYDIQVSSFFPNE